MNVGRYSGNENVSLSMNVPEYWRRFRSTLNVGKPRTWGREPGCRSVGSRIAEDIGSRDVTYEYISKRNTKTA